MRLTVLNRCRYSCHDAEKSDSTAAMFVVGEVGNLVWAIGLPRVRKYWRGDGEELRGEVKGSKGVHDSSWRTSCDPKRGW